MVPEHEVAVPQLLTCAARVPLTHNLDPVERINIAACALANAGVVDADFSAKAVYAPVFASAVAQVSTTAQGAPLILPCGASTTFTSDATSSSEPAPSSIPIAGTKLDSGSGNASVTPSTSSATASCPTTTSVSHGAPAERAAAIGALLARPVARLLLTDVVRVFVDGILEASPLAAWLALLDGAGTDLGIDVDAIDRQGSTAAADLAAFLKEIKGLRLSRQVCRLSGVSWFAVNHKRSSLC